MSRNKYKKTCHRYKAKVSKIHTTGWVTERLKVPVLKTGEGESLPWVRIPPHPPLLFKYKILICFLIKTTFF